MTLRTMLSTNAERPQVEALLDMLVNAAVFIGAADGRLGESELNLFIDSMREVVSSVGNEALVTSIGSTTSLLDRARKARRDLKAQGEEAFLKQLAQRFPVSNVRAGLVLAYRIVLADGKTTATEASAFEKLAAVLGIDSAESQVLREVATQARPADKRGLRSSLELLQGLEKTGWTKHGDDAVSFQSAVGNRLLLELEASESSLHVRLQANTGEPTLLICFFGENLNGLLAVLDAIKTTLSPLTLNEKLPALRVVSERVFIKSEGRLSAPP